MKLRKIDRAKKRDVKDKTHSGSRLKSLVCKERKDPLAPNPRNAMLTTKKAK